MTARSSFDSSASPSVVTTYRTTRFYGSPYNNYWGPSGSVRSRVRRHRRSRSVRSEPLGSARRHARVDREHEHDESVVEQGLRKEPLEEGPARRSSKSDSSPVRSARRLRSRIAHRTASTVMPPMDATARRVFDERAELREAPSPARARPTPRALARRRTTSPRWSNQLC